MNLPKWILPTLLHFLSLSRLASATGDDKAPAVTASAGPSFMFGFALSENPTSPTVTPHQLQPSLSLDLNFVLQVADYELKIPIMPLHLLGKKSWNVYNTANIEVVKRDEAIAAAEEAASEQRMQELDSLRRMQILRGEEPTPLPIEDSPKLDSSKHPRERGEGTGRERKKRKRAGENDTDFEMRIAHDMTNTENRERQLVLRKDTDAPLVNRRGHIDLFPQPKPSSHKTVQKNEEAERELAKKKKEYEDQYTLKFFNAAGFKSSLGSDPWYKKTNSTDVGEEMPGKDVWGNEDPRRKEREAKRIVSNDPLAMMKAGARQVRQVEQERKQWREEKDREMRALEEQERERRHRKRKRREADSEDDLEGFSLDNHGGSSSKKHRSGDHRERRHRHSSSSRRHSHRDDDRTHRHKSRRYSHE